MKYFTGFTRIKLDMNPSLLVKPKRSRPLRRSYSFFSLYLLTHNLNKIIIMNAERLNYLKRKYNTVLDVLDKKNHESLSDIDIKYYTEVMTANVNKQAEIISKLQKDLEQTKTNLAMYKQYLRKLKALS
jgi:coenzyme F420-reducing hydrogenase alpha subunit